MKLTAQNLKFIDNYLKNSEIFYDDVRMELTDHIATAVEERMQTENIDFYDAFKNYMLSNKKELIKKFSGNGYKSFEPIKSFGLFVMKPFMLVFAIVFFSGFLFLQTHLDKIYFVKEFQHYWLLSLMCFLIIHTGYFYFIKKKRFFAIEQSFLVLSILHFILMFITNPLNFESYFLIFWIDIFLVFLSVAFLFFYYNRIKKYYNNKHIWN